MSHFAISLLLGLTAALANGIGGLVLLRIHDREGNRRGLHHHEARHRPGQEHADQHVNGGETHLHRGPGTYLYGFIAFGAGFLMSVTLVEMIPESLRQGGVGAGDLWLSPVLILAGFCFVHLLEHTLSPHFHFGEETHGDQMLHAHTGYSIAIGLAAHTFFDGIAIASGFVLSSRLGWLIFAAILLHKLPEGFTISSVMLASGHGRRAALGSAVLLGASTLAGVAVLGTHPGLVRYALPAAAGVTLYVAATDLLPEVNKERGLKYRVIFFLGVGIFVLLDWIGA